MTLTLRLLLLFLLKCDDGQSLLEFLQVEFLGCLLHELALEVFHSEFHAPQLQHVELPDLVVLTTQCHSMIGGGRMLTYFPCWFLRERTTSQSRSTLSSSSFSQFSAWSTKKEVGWPKSSEIEYLTKFHLVGALNLQEDLLIWLVTGLTNR